MINFFRLLCSEAKPTYKGEGKMADVFSKAKRSQIMKSVKSRGNKSTEMELIRFFNEYHITGWRRNYNVKGHPDFVFPILKIAIFVDGCFWHGHDCRNTKPADNADYWNNKRTKNIEHDLQITQQFENRGWRVIRVWECELRKKKRHELLSKLDVLIPRETIIERSNQNP